MRRNGLPVKLRIEFGEIGGRFIAELPVETDFLEFIVEGICLAQILRIAELPNQIGSPDKRPFFVAIVIGLDS